MYIKVNSVKWIIHYRCTVIVHRLASTLDVNGRCEMSTQPTHSRQGLL